MCVYNERSGVKLRGAEPPSPHAPEHDAEASRTPVTGRAHALTRRRAPRGGTVFAESRRAIPAQRNELIALHHTDDAVIAEVDILGTHLGPLRALPPTGRAFRCRISAHILFEDERLVCERVYFDQLTIMRQLGLAHDSRSLAGRLTTLISHPPTIGRALARRASRTPS